MMLSRREFLGSTAAAGTVAATGPWWSSAWALGAAPAAAAGPGKHELPPLPYSYDALEPYIPAEIMKIHHDKHHAGYVKGLNKAEQALASAQATKDFSQVPVLERALAFHGSGHINHTIYWDNMKPGGAKQPQGALAVQINSDFGSFAAFKAQFTMAAAKVEGNGWGALVYSPMFNRLYTLAMLNHQNSHMTGTITLLIADVWEHAYYLKYQNRRGDYLTAWWNLVNWDDVGARFDAVRAK
jgi:Fe-Mn family superoxide dismutase